MAGLRHLAKLLPALSAVASRNAAGTLCNSLAVQASPAAAKASMQSLGAVCTRGLHFSSITSHDAVQEAGFTSPTLHEPLRKYRPLGDKELWHEAWMYEDRFGTEEKPILVPSLEEERIIGVTDPEDDNLVVWGILRAGNGPMQLIENGEYYVLKVVPYVAKVGDVLELEAGSTAPAVSTH